MAGICTVAVRGHRHSHRVQGEDIRELVVHENYLVFYRFDAARVEIVAVIHAHQRWP